MRKLKFVTKNKKFENMVDYMNGNIDIGGIYRTDKIMH